MQATAMTKLTPEDLLDIWLKLQAVNLDVVVVGGQAINLWAVKYSDRCPELLDFLPFASEDLDFYGGKLEAITCRDALEGEVKLNQDFDPSPNSGVVITKRGNRTLRIDFLASVVSSEDLEELEFKDLQTNKGQSGRELGYMINSSLGSNKFCEDLLIPKTSSKIDLYIFITTNSDGSGDQFSSEIHYVSQTETGCATIVYPQSFG